MNKFITLIKHKLKSSLYRFGLMGPEHLYTKNYFQKRKGDPYRSDAHNVSKTLWNYFEPESVIDFGCSIGTHLEYFLDRNAKVRGIESSEFATKYSVIPEEKIRIHDLRDYYDSGDTFDLVLSFEVAEHLPERSSDDFVKTLVDAGKTIVMTAAHPGQGGIYHLNEQPKEYWIEKFNSLEYEYSEDLSTEISKKMNVQKTEWIPENLMIFVKR